MIDAPELESLALFCGNHGESMDPIAFYIAYGIPNVITEARIRLGGVVPYCPIYPTLRHLALISYFGGPNALYALLNSLNNVTGLDWAPGYYTPKLLDTVFTTPGLCPNLKHLRIKGVSEDELARTVDILIGNGAPLKIVQVKARNWLIYGSRLTERFVGSGQGPQLETIGPYETGELEGEDSDFGE
ncbi:hypothetical protein ACGC1H_006816 [Rhizoctonia solani]